MNLLEVLSAAPGGPFRTGKVSSHTNGLSVVMSGKEIVGVPYIHAKPSVGSIVLLAYVGDRLVCLGPFGTDVQAPLAVLRDHPYDSQRPFDASSGPFNG